MKEEFELIAKTFQGLEEVLAKELTELGASNIEVGRRMVAVRFPACTILSLRKTNASMVSDSGIRELSKYSLTNMSNIG